MKRSGTVLALAFFAVSALAVAASPARSDGRIRIAYDLVGIPVPILHAYVAGVLAGHRASAKLYGRPEIVCTPPEDQSGGEVHRRAAAPARRTRRTYAAGRARRPPGAGQDIPLPGRLSLRPWRCLRIGGTTAKAPGRRALRDRDRGVLLRPVARRGRLRPYQGVSWPFRDRPARRRRPVRSFDPEKRAGRVPRPTRIAVR